jgi:hypothetical protein
MRRMLAKSSILLVLALAPVPLTPLHGQGLRSPSPPGARVYFAGLDDGATIPADATIRFAVEGMSVVPASADKPNSGHHHLIIDSETPPLDREIPLDRRHLHFGSGQTETQIDLPPGEHTLQLVFGDKNHVPHDPPLVSKRITVNVLPEDASPR